MRARECMWLRMAACICVCLHVPVCLLRTYGSAEAYPSWTFAAAVTATIGGIGLPGSRRPLPPPRSPTSSSVEESRLAATDGRDRGAAHTVLRPLTRRQNGTRQPGTVLRSELYHRRPLSCSYAQSLTGGRPLEAVRIIPARRPPASPLSHAVSASLVGGNLGDDGRSV
eukprot:GHVU01017597.1.p2 GENE.GHVU01017597.1~~GHVU01017597.1.p2  ORF type:complete len:169 (+),score=6.65 GHVU01017597.1:228-734(+)